MHLFEIKIIFLNNNNLFIANVNHVNAYIMLYNYIYIYIYIYIYNYFFTALFIKCSLGENIRLLYYIYIYIYI